MYWTEVNSLLKGGRAFSKSLSIDVHQVMMFCICLLLLSFNHISTSSSSSSSLSYQPFQSEYFWRDYDFQEMQIHSQGLHLMIIRIKDQRSEGGTQLGRVFTAIQFACQLWDFSRSVKNLKSNFYQKHFITLFAPCFARKNKVGEKNPPPSQFILVHRNSPGSLLSPFYCLFVFLSFCYSISAIVSFCPSLF